MPIADIPVPGLAGPCADTPRRVDGSVRRTSHVDVVRRRPGWDADAVVEGVARDLVTPAAGTDPRVDVWSLRIETAGLGGPVASIRSDPAEPALHEVVGTPLMAGFRRACAGAVPRHVQAGTPLHRLLDDAPLAFLVSGHALTLEEPPPLPTGQEPARPRTLKPDLCAGWQVGGALLTVLEETGQLPHSLGPVAPDLGRPDDPLAWHERPALPPMGTRRSRRLDVVPGEDGSPMRVDAHFRDSYADLEGVERSLHEYTVLAEVDPRTGTVLSAVAVPRALPWTECPQALGSVARLVGRQLRELPDLVRREFTGITTCTHLNDTMRSLADAWALLALVGAAPTETDA